MEISVYKADLEYILDTLYAIQEEQNDLYKLVWANEREEPTGLITLISMVRSILGLEEEDEYDEEAQQESLELRFDE